jgi:hypothetical protein
MTSYSRDHQRAPRGQWVAIATPKTFLADKLTKL